MIIETWRLLVSIEISVSYSIVIDFILSLARVSSEEIGFGFFSKDNETLDRFKPDENLNKLLKKIDKEFSNDKKDIAKKYFNSKTVIYKSIIYYIRLHKMENISELIEFLKSIDPFEFAARHLYLFSSAKKYGLKKIEYQNCKEYINNSNSLMNLIKDSNITPERKWELVEFYNDPKKSLEEIIGLIEWYQTNIFEKVESKIIKSIEKCSNELKRKIDSYGSEYLDLLLNIDYKNLDSNKTIGLTVSFFSEIGYIFFIMGEKEDFYVVGFRHMEIFVEREHQFLSCLHLFKTLGDETRLNIIKLLHQNVMYGDEIAKKLKLSNSTISYHLNMLILEGIVKLNRVDKKNYLTLKKDRLENLLKDSYKLLTSGSSIEKK
jgi:DNA-binding transcriptional ArsR family regulator